MRGRDRLESEPIDFHERVRQEFLQIARLDPERYFIVDGTDSIEEIHTAIIHRVSEIPTLRRNQSDENGNRLLKPVRAITKATKSAATRARTPRTAKKK